MDLVSFICVLVCGKIAKRPNKKGTKPRKWSKSKDVENQHVRLARVGEQEASSPNELWRGWGEITQSVGRGKTVSWSIDEGLRIWVRRERPCLHGEIRYFGKGGLMISRQLEVPKSEVRRAKPISPGEKWQIGKDIYMSFCWFFEKALNITPFIFTQKP